jgi:hypothetical protein
MDHLLFEMKTLLDNGMWFSSLTIALTIPDICASLESSNGNTNGELYARWFDTYVANRYQDSLTGKDVYKLRCAYLHQGIFNHNYPDMKR